MNLCDSKKKQLWWRRHTHSNYVQARCIAHSTVLVNMSSCPVCICRIWTYTVFLWTLFAKMPTQLTGNLQFYKPQVSQLKYWRMISLNITRTGVKCNIFYITKQQSVTRNAYWGCHTFLQEKNSFMNFHSICSYIIFCTNFLFSKSNKHVSLISAGMNLSLRIWALWVMWFLLDKGTWLFGFIYYLINQFSHHV